MIQSHPHPVVNVCSAETVADMATFVAEQTVALLRRRSATTRASVILAGGTSPAPIYRNWAETPEHFAGVDFYFGDERCVPPDDARSNYRMFLEAVDDVDAMGATVHRLRGEDDPQNEAARYGALLAPISSYTFAILGVGADAHTASLFPGHQELEGAVVPAEHQGVSRLSMNFRELAKANEVFMFVPGEGKDEALASVLQGGTSPAGRVARSTTTTLVITHACAERLRARAAL